MRDDQMPSLSKTDRAILEVLEKNGWRAMYGREIADASPVLSRGSIYVLLDRMEVKKNLLTSEKNEGEQRRYYKVRGHGKLALSQARELERFKASSPLWGGTKGVVP